MLCGFPDNYYFPIICPFLCIIYQFSSYPSTYIDTNTMCILYNVRSLVVITVVATWSLRDRLFHQTNSITTGRLAFGLISHICTYMRYVYDFMSINALQRQCLAQRILIDVSGDRVKLLYPLMVYYMFKITRTKRVLVPN